MSVIQTVYNYLESNEELRELLGQSTIDPTKKAIYEEWADHETGFPYMNLSFSFGNSDIHYAKQETLLNIDIFTESDSIIAERIKNACVFALDRQTLIDLEDGAFVRIYYNRDGYITEPTDGISHWNIEFNLYHWRNKFIEHIQ